MYIRWKYNVSNKLKPSRNKPISIITIIIIVSIIIIIMIIIIIIIIIIASNIVIKIKMVWTANTENYFCVYPTDESQLNIKYVHLMITLRFRVFG